MARKPTDPFLFLKQNGEEFFLIKDMATDSVLMVFGAASVELNDSVRETIRQIVCKKGEEIDGD